MPRGVNLSLEDLLLIPLGFAVGAFGTLVGAGGGFLLVPVLLFLHPDRPPEEITAISLFVVLLSALSGSAAYARQQRTDYRSGLWFAAGTLPGAVAGALLVGAVPRRLFDAAFALLLIGLALFLALRRESSAIREPTRGRGTVMRMIRDRYGNTYVYSFQLWKGVALSVGVGLFSSLLGIGGGVLHVPIMATVLHFPMHTAVATSQFTLAFMSAEASAVHVLTGTLAWNRALGEAGLLAIGSIAGAQVGAWAGQRLPGVTIRRALAASLLLVGIRLGMEAFGL